MSPPLALLVVLSVMCLILGCILRAVMPMFLAHVADPDLEEISDELEEWEDELQTLSVEFVKLSARERIERQGEFVKRREELIADLNKITSHLVATYQPPSQARTFAQWAVD